MCLIPDLDWDFESTGEDQEDRTLFEAPPPVVLSDEDRKFLATRPPVCLSGEGRNSSMNIYISLTAIETESARLNENFETKINRINKKYPFLELAEFVGMTVPSAT